jgi:hypothetical protein
MASGEFNPQPDAEAGDNGQRDPGNTHEVRSPVDRVKAIQAILQVDQLYAGPIDGDFGGQSAVAMGKLATAARRQIHGG